MTLITGSHHCSLIARPPDPWAADAAEVAARARHARHDAVGRGVDVRHERKVGAVARLDEDGGERHEPDECAQRHAARRRRVHAAGDDEQRAAEHAARRDPQLLPPQVAAALAVEYVGDDAAEGPRDDVEEAKDGGAVAGRGLREVREVVLVVGAEDGVDGELAAKGARVRGDVKDGLRGEQDGKGVAEARLRDDLALGNVHGLLVRELRREGQLGGAALFLVGRVRLGRRGQARVDGRREARVGAAAGAALEDAHVLVDALLALLPGADGRVRAQQQHAEGAGHQAHERHDKGDAPRRRRAEPLAGDERVKDGGHDEVGDAAAGVAPAAGEGVCGADDVLVEEAGAPHLARHKRGPEHPQEEARRVQPAGAAHERRQPDRQAPDEQQPDEDAPRPKQVAQRARGEPQQERGHEGDNVGVGHLHVGEVQVLFDGDGEERRERVPVRGFDMLVGRRVAAEGGRDTPYQAQKASMKPIQEKKKTRPYMSTGLRTGMLRAFLLTGHTSGAAQRAEKLKRGMAVTNCVLATTSRRRDRELSLYYTQSGCASTETGALDSQQSISSTHTRSRLGRQ
ncbi:hypothetical protein CCM_02302 [Cordyceps militaris CM01]|uniref:Uncharacterized protein n=1 Tax=Cordyceps militaris (strain CM01) TaxID=983644 RepID=G3J8Z9_CORMM|nr:uncharacterized protein CCM_02302 [Cordyceps militaris CM01]EGX94031.1 hypothetical protein CCM_02302 [Cordyceps militaris CM01]